MKLVNCKVCGQQVAKSAKKCPHCGKRRPPLERNPIGATIGLIFLILFFALVALVISSSTSTEPQENNNLAQSPVTTPPVEDVPAFNAVDISISNWDITITNFYFSESVEVGLLTEYRPNEDAQFVIVELDVKNIGTDPETFLPLLPYGGDTVVKLRCGDYTFTRSELLFADDTISTEVLNPLVSTSGKICFEFPTELIDTDNNIELIISADWQEQIIPLT